MPLALPFSGNRSFVLIHNSRYVPSASRHFVLKLRPSITAKHASGKEDPQVPDEEDPGLDKFKGNPEVQDALAEVMMLSVRKEKVKEDIRQDVEAKKEKIRNIGKELTDDFERKIELDKMRTELASNMSLAETMQKFQAVEDELQALRDKLKEDREELADWEDRTAQARNQGLFFKRLHKTRELSSSRTSGEGSEGTLEGESKKPSSEVLRNIKNPAAGEVTSSWRLLIFAYLALVPLAVLIEDLQSQAPDYGLDAFYLALAVAMAYNVWEAEGNR
ncbi:hypothetical protein CEUSTIGMA_g12881.t1 [Chlamydomonas eustigma]|uniref:Uncharacterized protein n=1 Tax=Chlamydomonas eustigma TaxID=1157962 RepID=A0A250XQY1_9CHLO|nr:hypothetical protein CEUSTIGMA_g12881.t1 [Chlamydomonas eustigma]|eukprot:GAX85465.1 hypothetical protein CEUSTIGMA_g12881.t1 [Chlamydomonas eustigma]